MKKIATLTLGLSLFANAHFLTFISNTDNVSNTKQTKIDFDNVDTSFCCYLISSKISGRFV